MRGGQAARAGGAHTTTGLPGPLRREGDFFTVVRGSVACGSGRGVRAVGGYHGCLAAATVTGRGCRPAARSAACPAAGAACWLSWTASGLGSRYHVASVV